MSQGKYSPWCYRNRQVVEYDKNAYGEDTIDVDVFNYNEMLMFANYDSQGFDSYGYSAFDIDGNYVGIGSGIDRYGRTEYEYLCMDPDDYDDVQYCSIELTEFARKR